MVGHAQRDGWAAGGDDAGNAVVLRDDERERAGPAGVGERVGFRRPIERQSAGGRGVAGVDDERVCRWPALGLEDPLNSRGVERVGAEAVDGLGGERDEAAGAKALGRAADGVWSGRLGVDAQEPV